MIWLNLVDAGQYGASWDESAEDFKMSLSREQWEQMLGAVRTPLGNREKRELKAKRYKTSVPGAPDGHYVVIQFNTSFKNKAKAIETVTPMKDPDGQWRVAGYFIK